MLQAYGEFGKFVELAKQMSKNQSVKHKKLKKRKTVKETYLPLLV